MIEDTIVEALVKIGNHKETMKLCEPHVSEPMELKSWMVRRTLKTLELLANEWNKLSKNT